STCLFSLTHTATPQPYTLSLHDALPISRSQPELRGLRASDGTGRQADAAPTSRVLRAAASARSLPARAPGAVQRQVLPRVAAPRSEEHTSELQSRRDLVCRLLLEKKK